jgi:hypothetical protein
MASNATATPAASEIVAAFGQHRERVRRYADDHQCGDKADVEHEDHYQALPAGHLRHFL